MIDCEILAIQTANEAANAGGNVDLVGLVKFNNEAEIMQGLIEPWTKLSPDSSDPAVVEIVRTITPKEATNFEAGVEQACALARDPKNDNDQTVVIFVSDGAPNLGVSSRDTIMKNCGGAIFQTYAVTEDADCDVVDEANLRPGIDNPDTLREISTFSGGTCTQVPDGELSQNRCSFGSSLFVRSSLILLFVCSFQASRFARSTRKDDMGWRGCDGG